MDSKNKHADMPAKSNTEKDNIPAPAERNVADSADAPAIGELAADDPNSDQKEKTFDILMNSVNYLVKVTPFVFNEETRYYVSVDDEPTNLFLWDVQMSQIRSLDDTASELPDGLEKEISNHLMLAESKHQL